MKRRLLPRTAAGLIAVVALAATALVLVPGASAAPKAGTLDCPTLTPFNANKYALKVGSTVTCTIDGASDASGKTTVPVIIKSSQLGNTTVTGTVSGSGSSTKVTFTFTAPTGGCNTVVVAYISNGNNTTLSGGNGGGFAYVDSSGNNVTTCGSATTANISFGYADNYYTHGSPNGLPWLGLSGALVIGCGVNPNGGGSAPDACPKDPNNTAVDSYDAGAIEIDNASSTAITVTNSSVQIGSCTYNPWPGLNISLAPGATLVLTQTGGAPTVCGTSVVGNYNFDTSESFFTLTGQHDGQANLNCANDGAVPSVTLTLNGASKTIADTGQILNTGGVDPPDCSSNANEFHAFTLVTQATL